MHWPDADTAHFTVAQISAADPAFALRVYAHLLPSSHDRARAVINERFSHLRLSPGSRTAKRRAIENRAHADGTETEQASGRRGR